MSHVLQFSCYGKRVINVNDFIGKEIILLLSGIKQREGFKKPIQHLNHLGENIYFKKIMPVTARQWDMYMYSIIHLIVFDYRYLSELIKFNEMIGGDERVDKAIENSNKIYHPMSPPEDYRKRYIWRPMRITSFTPQFDNDEWNVTIPIGYSSIDYWMRKLRKRSICYICGSEEGADGADGEEGADGTDGADGADGEEGADGAEDGDSDESETVD